MKRRLFVVLLLVGSCVFVVGASIWTPAPALATLVHAVDAVAQPTWIDEGMWGQVDSLSLGRLAFRATTLQNGMVLVTGGAIQGGHTAETEIYDPSVGLWTSAGNLHDGRSGHTATLLQDGRVLIAGGYSGPVLNSAELFDPATNTFTRTANMNQVRTRHTATLLTNGKVLVAGGWLGAITDQAELYDPISKTWSLIGPMFSPHSDHIAALLDNGKVLIAGGTMGVDGQGHGILTAQSELYDPSTQAFTRTGSMQITRTLFTAAQLPDGRVLAVGGYLPDGSPTVSTEIYDPQTGAWALAGSMHVPRAIGYQAAINLQSGAVLVAGGWGDITGTSEIYSPTLGAWSSPVPMQQSQCESAITLLHDGRVLLAGGTECGSPYTTVLTAAQIYTPSNGVSPDLTPPSTTRISVASDDTQGNRNSSAASISADGRFAAFTSSASNLVISDTNTCGGPVGACGDIFVRDRLTNQTTRVSIASDGMQSNNESNTPVISADGRYVAFSSSASNLVVSDTNTCGVYSPGVCPDIFVHDRQTGETTRVSIASDGTEANGPSYHPSITADGRYVAFNSFASNLVSGDTNNNCGLTGTDNCEDIFVHDRLTGETTRVSVSTSGIEGSKASGNLSISADGRYVVFDSLNGYVLVDSNITTDVYVHDRQTGQTNLVSMGLGNIQADGSSRNPSLSADGRYVAYASNSSNLVSNDTNMCGGNPCFDVFVFDRQISQTVRISVASDGAQGDDNSWTPNISADGRYVAFWSYATNLVNNDLNGNPDVFIHDLFTGQTERVSVASDDTEANYGSVGAAISADGQYVAFTSTASNLVADDTNDYNDAFVRDRGGIGSVVGMSVVTISGPAVGTLGTAYAFTANVAPPTATLPITLTWSADNQPPLTPTGVFTTSDTVFFTWASVPTGTKLITVTAENAVGRITGTHTIVIDAISTTITPLSSITISGPTTGTLNTSYAFVATAGPITVSQPITYLWQSPGQPTLQHVGDLSDTVRWSWPTSGPQAITVTATNAGGTVSHTHTISLTAPPAGSDAFEPDDVCSQAHSLSTDGAIQSHTFHQQADQDWLVFNAISGTTYLIDALVPIGSPANMALEIYDQCANLPLGGQDYTFSADVRLQFVASSTGPLYLKFFNDQPTVYGPNVSYLALVRQLVNTPTPGAVILVAGRLRASDPLQSNIHAVTNAAYQFFTTVGYTSTRLYYLATNSALPGYDSSATIQHLQAAITTWALDKVDAERPLTLYLVDHGDYDRLYLDALSGQWITPQQLDEWLDQLETARPGVPINIIIEACKSGSFIDWVQSISKPGRVIISSTSAQNLAWASDTGALFSDHLLNALTLGDSLFTGFLSARSAVVASQPYQFPWLDDNGDGLPNGLQDGEAAQLRSFVTTGTFADDEWPPYIATATGPVSIINHQGVVQAAVVDDPAGGVRRVWAVVYPPSYQPPTSSEDLVSEPLSTIMLLAQGGDSYAASYTGFNEIGVYRVVIHAEDNMGVAARPLTIEVRTGWKVFLPIVIRS